MNSDDENMILSAASAKTSPDGPAILAKLLKHFGETDGRALGLRLLNQAVADEDATDVELAIIVCDLFGFGDEHTTTLVNLANANWHYKHQDIATMLTGIKTPETVDALHNLATWVPEYLEFDENRSLSKKAIRAMARIPGDSSQQALRELADSETPVVSEFAQAQLRRRNDKY